MKRLHQLTNSKRNTNLRNHSNSTSPHDDRLSELIATTNSDVNFTRTELFFFLGVLAFIGLTALGVSDRELLIGARAKLPLLDISIDLEQFLATSPLATLATSFVLLLKFSKIKRKFIRINELLAEVAKRSRRDARTYELRLTSNFITQWLIEPAENKFERRLSFLIYLCCLWVIPIICHLFIILRTLPLHSEAISFFQLVTVTTHLWLIAYFHSVDRAAKTKATVLSCFFGLLIGLVFSVPDGRLDRLGVMLWPTSVPIAGKDVYFRERQAFFPTAVLLESGVDSQTRRPILWFSRNLVVRFSQQLPDASPSNNTPQTSFKISLRGRDLRYAVLNGSDLRGVDFTLADLTGANLANTDLRGAKFGCVIASHSANYFSYLRGRLRLSSDTSEANFGYSWYDSPAACTILSNVDFSGADFRGISIESAQSAKPVFADLRFTNANLAGVDLSQTNISRSSFTSANLSGATLTGAHAVGAVFVSAQLIGANLINVDARLANFSSAQLIAADLTFMDLSGAVFFNAKIRGSNLSEVNLTAANFKDASIWQTDLPQDMHQLTWGNFNQLRVRAPDSTEVDYWKRALASLQLAQKAEADLIAKAHSPIWSGRQWIEVNDKLKRDDKDAMYRAAYTKFVLSYACFDIEFLYALVQMARDGLDSYSYDVYYPDEMTLELPIDPALIKVPVRQRKSVYSDYSDFEQQGPVVPSWFDYRQVHKALSEAKCRSVESVRETVIDEIGVLFQRHYDKMQERQKK